MSVSPEDVRHIAKLSRLGIDESMVPELVTELNGILQHMEELQSVDLSGSLAVHNTESAPLRPDDFPADTLKHRREDFAPSMRDGFFLVPRLATHDAQGTSSEIESAT